MRARSSWIVAALAGGASSCALASSNRQNLLSEEAARVRAWAVPTEARNIRTAEGAAHSLSGESHVSWVFDVPEPWPEYAVWLDTRCAPPWTSTRSPSTLSCSRPEGWDLWFLNAEPLGNQMSVTFTVLPD